MKRIQRKKRSGPFPICSLRTTVTCIAIPVSKPNSTRTFENKKLWKRKISRAFLLNDENRNNQRKCLDKKSNFLIRRNHLQQCLFPIREVHQCVISGEERIGNTREARTEAPLDNNHRSCLIHVQDWHSRNRAFRVGAGDRFTTSLAPITIATSVC